MSLVFVVRYGGCAQLTEMFGDDARKSFVKGHRFSWGQQPYVRGGYTCMCMDELPTDRATVAAVIHRSMIALSGPDVMWMCSVDLPPDLLQPHAGRVFFAGEAYSPAYNFSPMTLQGAARSNGSPFATAARCCAHVCSNVRSVVAWLQERWARAWRQRNKP